MKKLYRPFALAALIGVSAVGFIAADITGGYVETDLVVNKSVNGVPTLSDANGIVHVAKFFDPHLVNPWGVGESASSPFWIRIITAPALVPWNSHATVSPSLFCVGLPRSVPSAAFTIDAGTRLQVSEDDPASLRAAVDGPAACWLLDDPPPLLAVTTTTRVFPNSFSFFKIPIKRSLSRGCKPTVGSSSTWVLTCPPVRLAG